MISSIDNKVAQALVGELESALDPTQAVRVSAEIQDAGEFVLFVVEVLVDNAASDWRDFLKSGAGILERAMPERDGSYRWMIVIKIEGEVANAVMGGWKGMPTV